MESKLQNFCAQAKALYGDRLRSILVYGSVASGEHIPRRSNVNLLVCLDRVDFEALELSRKFFQRWKRFTRTLPLLFDRRYMETSSDVFPMEFLDIQQSYRVLFGEDVLKPLVVDRKSLRFQCESEIKGKLVRLRQAYLEAVFLHDWKQVLIASIPSFLTIFRNLIRLKGQEPPVKAQDVVGHAARLYRVNADAAQTLLKLKSGLRLSRVELVDLYRAWLAEVEALANAVDQEG